MELHPLATNFATVADEYERGRPDYPPAVIGAIAAELQLAPGARVLDLAAGTGKLSRSLRRGGFDVVAVEPLPSLRRHLTGILGVDSVREGVAEAIPLEGSSVDAVTVADAFHWFDQARAIGEIERVLRPGGGLAILNTVPDWRAASWGHELGSLVASLRPEHPNFDGPPWQDSVRQTGAWTEPREIRVTTPQPFPAERVVDYLASFSWIAALPDQERNEAVGQIRAILASGESPPELPIHVIVGLTEMRA